MKNLTKIERLLRRRLFKNKRSKWMCDTVLKD